MFFQVFAEAGVLNDSLQPPGKYSNTTFFEKLFPPLYNVCKGCPIWISFGLPPNGPFPTSKFTEGMQKMKLKKSPFLVSDTSILDIQHGYFNLSVINSDKKTVDLIDFGMTAKIEIDFSINGNNQFFSWFKNNQKTGKIYCTISFFKF